MDPLGPSPPEQHPPSPLQLAPGTIRDRRGSFPRIDRGYAPEAVDTFLTTVADCLDDVANRNHELTDHVNELATKVALHEGRAWAVQEAMVAAQTVRTKTMEDAETEADQIRALAAQEADALLSASRAERDRILAEVEELMARASRLRQEIEGPLEERRQESLARAQRILEEAQAEATAQAMRIRDHAKAEVEVLRREANEEDARVRAASARKSEALLERARAEAVQLRAEAEQAVKQMEDESLLHLERQSLQLTAQITERHAALERLEERRLEFLDRLGAILMRQLRTVERERTRSPLGPDQAGDLGSDLLITDPQERTERVSVHQPDEGTGRRSIIMPDSSVVILPRPSDGRIGPTPLTDGPSPLDPGSDPPDDDPPLAADAGPLDVLPSSTDKEGPATRA